MNTTVDASSSLPELWSCTVSLLMDLDQDDDPTADDEQFLLDYPESSSSDDDDDSEVFWMDTSPSPQDDDDLRLSPCLFHNNSRQNSMLSFLDNMPSCVSPESSSLADYDNDMDDEPILTLMNDFQTSFVRADLIPSTSLTTSLQYQQGLAKLLGRMQETDQTRVQILPLLWQTAMSPAATTIRQDSLGHRQELYRELLRETSVRPPQVPEL
jgi:hypothetical protein